MRRFLLLLILPLCVFGCRKGEPENTAPPKPKAPTRVSEEIIQKHKPNEAGAVMVVMYHRILATEADNDLNRRPETFRKDLETLRAKNYYPVNAIDFVNGAMQVPAGKTPVVLTFDDALPSQFRVIQKNGKDSIDPNCAVGILETFSKKNKDWPMRATFFVLPKVGRNAEPFGQAEYVAQKFDYLAKNGYEIANHTSTHTSMRSMSVEKIKWELATAVKNIQSINNKAAMLTLALPYGKTPREAAAKKALMAGESGGTRYENKAVFEAAWRPVASPLTKNDQKLMPHDSICPFDPSGLERVKADVREAKLPGTLEYWLKFFDKNPSLRYVSDGEDKIVAIPASLKPMIDENKAKAQGRVLQFYGGGASSSGGKGSGGDLSVD